METDQSALVQENNAIQSADTPELLVSDDANLIGHNGSMVGLSPVQIQQEYFENLADCDWVKWVWYFGDFTCSTNKQSWYKNKLYLS